MIGRANNRAAFTLLEIVLTVSMSVVLMSLVGAAIQFYARDMDVNDMDIRQTQLAAAIMQMIEDDLRGTVHNEPVDMSGLAALLSSVGGQAETANAGGGAGGETDLSAAGFDSATEDAATVEMETPDLTTGVAVLQSPGLIGNQYQIQIDVSRLPRLEEYLAMMDETITDVDDVPSDLKTVTYFVQPAGSSGVIDQLTNQDAFAVDSGGGLVRRALDRAATTYAATAGNTNALNQTGDLIAPEVIAIEFSYWDGLIWELEWSSDEFDELPLAVKIQLTMTNSLAVNSPIAVEDENATRVFTHIVRIPMAKPIEDETETEELSEAGI